MTNVNAKTARRPAITKEVLNDLLLENMGLDVDEDTGEVYDVDSEHTIIVRCRKLVDRDNVDYRREVRYDPIGNPSLMDKLFKYFLGKYSRENDVGIKMVSYGPIKKGYKSYIEVVMEDDSVCNSGWYYNDCIKCASIILKLSNDIIPYDLSKLDDEIYKELQKEENRRYRRRG